MGSRTERELVPGLRDFLNALGSLGLPADAEHSRRALLEVLQSWHRKEPGSSGAFSLRGIARNVLKNCETWTEVSPKPPPLPPRPCSEAANWILVRSSDQTRLSHSELIEAVRNAAETDQSNDLGAQSSNHGEHLSENCRKRDHGGSYGTVSEPDFHVQVLNLASSSHFRPVLRRPNGNAVAGNKLTGDEWSTKWRSESELLSASTDYEKLSGSAFTCNSQQLLPTNTCEYVTVSAGNRLEKRCIRLPVSTKHVKKERKLEAKRLAKQRKLLFEQQSPGCRGNATFETTAHLCKSLACRGGGKPSWTRRSRCVSLFASPSCSLLIAKRRSLHLNFPWRSSCSTMSDFRESDSDYAVSQYSISSRLSERQCMLIPVLLNCKLSYSESLLGRSNVLQINTNQVTETDESPRPNITNVLLSFSSPSNCALLISAIARIGGEKSIRIQLDNNSQELLDRFCNPLPSTSFPAAEDDRLYTKCKKRAKQIASAIRGLGSIAQRKHERASLLSAFEQPNELCTCTTDPDYSTVQTAEAQEQATESQPQFQVAITDDFATQTETFNGVQSEQSAPSADLSGPLLVISADSERMMQCSIRKYMFEITQLDSASNTPTIVNETAEKSSELESMPIPTSFTLRGCRVELDIGGAYRFRIVQSARACRTAQVLVVLQADNEKQWSTWFLALDQLTRSLSEPEPAVSYVYTAEHGYSDKMLSNAAEEEPIYDELMLPKIRRSNAVCDSLMRRKVGMKKRRRCCNSLPNASQIDEQTILHYRTLRRSFSSAVQSSAGNSQRRDCATQTDSHNFTRNAGNVTNDSVTSWSASVSNRDGEADESDYLDPIRFDQVPDCNGKLKAKVRKQSSEMQEPVYIIGDQMLPSIASCTSTHEQDDSDTLTGQITIKAPPSALPTDQSSCSASALISYFNSLNSANVPDYKVRRRAFVSNEQLRSEILASIRCLEAVLDDSSTESDSSMSQAIGMPLLLNGHCDSAISRWNEVDNSSRVFLDLDNEGHHVLQNSCPLQLNDCSDTLQLQPIELQSNVESVNCHHGNSLTDL